MPPPPRQPQPAARRSVQPQAPARAPPRLQGRVVRRSTVTVGWCEQQRAVLPARRLSKLARADSRQQQLQVWHQHTHLAAAGQTLTARWLARRARRGAGGHACHASQACLQGGRAARSQSRVCAGANAVTTSSRTQCASLQQTHRPDVRAAPRACAGTAAAGRRRCRWYRWRRHGWPRRRGCSPCWLRPRWWSCGATWRIGSRAAWRARQHPPWPAKARGRVKARVSPRRRHRRCWRAAPTGAALRRAAAAARCRRQRRRQRC